MRMKTTIAAALQLAGTSLALAQTPPTTGGVSPYPNNAGAAQEPGPGGGGKSAVKGKSAHHKKMAKHHHKTSASKS